MRIALAAFAAMLAVAPAAAAEIAISLSIPVTGDTEVSSTSSIYECGDEEISATYINAGDVSLAVLEIDGRTVVASNVIAASGAKYAGAQYIWWTKGDEANLYDLTEGGEDAPASTCAARE
jgi:membrane-bound inhibitor of C-type lysozyme